METNFDRRTVLKTIGLGALVAGPLSGTAVAYRGALQRDLAAVRSATASYNDPANAYAAGYTALDENGAPVALEDVTDDAEAVCEMGYHFVNLGLVGTVDRLQPQALVYGEDDDGNLILGAVEYIIPTAAVPTAEDWFHGDDDEWEPFDEAPLPFPASALHAWIHTNNPNGVFDHNNPRKQFSPSGCASH